MNGDITLEALRQCQRASKVLSPFIIFACDYASSTQISSQSDNMEPSYSQKKIIFNMASAYQISSYSDDSQLRYGAITMFKMAAVRHVGFIVTSSYCTVRLSLTILTLC